MGRPAAFDRTAIASAALSLVAEGGTRAATMAAIAKRMGAPTGSIYHRYASRDLLLADLWMTTVEGFQQGLLAALEDPDPLSACAGAARFSANWVRAHPAEARLLLLHRRDDFVEGPWPGELQGRSKLLRKNLSDGLRAYAARCFGSTAKANLCRVYFAILDVPLAAVKRYVESGRPMPVEVDQLMEAAALAALEPRPPRSRRAMGSA